MTCSTCSGASFFKDAVKCPRCDGVKLADTSSCVAELKTESGSWQESARLSLMNADISRPIPALLLSHESFAGVERCSKQN